LSAKDQPAVVAFLSRRAEIALQALEITPWQAAVHGFWSSISNDNTNTCKNTGSTTCAAADLVDQPGPSTVSAVDVLKARTSKDVDLWGAAVELDRPTGAPMMPGLFHSTYWGAGFDLRGLDQDMRIKGHDFTTDLFRYDETLNTTYYGGFISFGGEYTLGMLGMGGLWERWGLRSFFEAHAGLYSANTDYDGRFTPVGLDPSKLGLSQNDNRGVILVLAKQRQARARAELLAGLKLDVPTCATTTATAVPTASSTKPRSAMAARSRGARACG
jgi:hypothetical protein